jgi:large subunit ribosomal protein L18
MKRVFKKKIRLLKKKHLIQPRPRLCVFRSLNHIYAQVVDDLTGRSIAQTGSTLKEIAEKSAADKKMTKTAVSKLVGEMIAEKAKAKGIERVVFDRKGYAYHGRVKALADAARGKGLVF